MRARGIAIAAVAAALAPAAADAVPIPEETLLGGSPPPFLGKPFKPRPLDGPRVPRHPHMARNGRSVIHNDAYQSDTYRGPGPLGRGTETTSTFQVADCASVTFDRRGRIVTVCVGLEGPRLMLLDPRSLEPLARYQLPLRRPGSAEILTDFSGGGYFYLDDQDRAVVPTTDGRILVVAVTRGGAFELRRSYSVAGKLDQGEGINSALPDWDGRIWFVGTRGAVGAIDPASGAVGAIDLGEDIENSFAVDDSGGVYVVSDRALYRFDAGRGGAPRTTWRERYPNEFVQKPGQTDDASGTTPTLLGRRYVAITDNADPVAINVYRREADFRGPRRVCREPVFRRGASATDQSLIGNGRSLVAENNYGYAGPDAILEGSGTAPGFERVDLDRDGRGCRTVWTSDARAPSVVPKLSLATGLIYTYTKEPEGGDDGWYLTALDFRTGKRAFSVLAGTGLGFNNNYAPVTLGPDGSAYVGVLGGLTAFRDRR